MNEEYLKEVREIAIDIQNGELSRQRGILDVGKVSSMFDWEFVANVGQQRVNAALYLKNQGYQKPVSPAEDSYSNLQLERTRKTTAQEFAEIIKDEIFCALSLIKQNTFCFTKQDYKACASLARVLCYAISQRLLDHYGIESKRDANNQFNVEIERCKKYGIDVEIKK